jgi:hypothetical protein
MTTTINPGPDARKQYTENGFVFYEELLTAAEAAELLELVRPAMEGKLGHVGFGEAGNHEIKRGKQQQIRIGDDDPIPGLGNHIYRTKAQALCESLVGYPLRFAYGQVIAKPAHYEARVQWHQDGHYWQGNTASEAGISCWIALTECHPGNGSVGYVPGSHLTGVNQHSDATGDYEFHRAFEVADPASGKVVYADLTPGDAAMHHSLCIHGSSGNESDNPRIGMVSHFFPVD